MNRLREIFMPLESSYHSDFKRFTKSSKKVSEIASNRGVPEGELCHKIDARQGLATRSQRASLLGKQVCRFLFEDGARSRRKAIPAPPLFHSIKGQSYKP